MIELAPFDESHRAALENLQLPPEQHEFTEFPVNLLPDVLGDPNRLPVTILNDSRPIGFFILSVGEHRDKYLTAPDPHGVALGALSIDTSQQGRSIGTQAMKLLRGFVPAHFRGATHVLLVVNQRNPGAKRVYEKVGFQVTGERTGGRGPQWIMTLALK